jgi:hypothetical protein
MRSRGEFYASFSAYTKSFGTFDNAYPLLRVKAFMPPRGLLLCRFCPPRPPMPRWAAALQFVIPTGALGNGTGAPGSPQRTWVEENGRSPYLCFLFLEQLSPPSKSI